MGLVTFQKSQASVIGRSLRHKKIKKLNMNSLMSYMKEAGTDS